MIRKISFSLILVFLFSMNYQSYASKAIKPKLANANTLKIEEPKINEALSGFYDLSRKEKKEKVAAIKDVIKKFKQDKKSGVDTDTNLLLLAILAILLPPVAVLLYEGEINNRFWISLILTLLGFLPGIIYALVLILGNY